MLSVQAALPPVLRPADTIGIMAASARVDEGSLEPAVRLIEARGYKVRIHPQTYAVHYQSAGTADEKANAFRDLWHDPEIKAILMAKGGNRAGWMLPSMPPAVLAENRQSLPKYVIGYSDVTAILLSLYAAAGLPGIHGPMARTLAKGEIPPWQADLLFGLLDGTVTDIPLPGAAVIQEGTAEGPLLGGNLSLVTSLLGTPYAPDFTGAILFLEDCHEEWSRIDRMLAHLRNAGVFGRIAGLVLGGFTDMQDTGTIPFGMPFAAMIAEACAGMEGPIIWNAPFGHGQDLVSFPTGRKARLGAHGGNDIRLTLS